MKLIDADKLLKWLGTSERSDLFIDGTLGEWLGAVIDAGTFDPAPVPKPWDKVNHRIKPEWGTGKVMAVKDSEKGNALVYFAGREYKHQLTECEFSELEVITDDPST